MFARFCLAIVLLLAAFCAPLHGQLTIVGSGESHFMGLNLAMADGYEFFRVGVRFSYQSMSSVEDAIIVYNGGRSDYVFSLSTPPGQESSGAGDFTEMLHNMTQVPIGFHVFVPMVYNATASATCSQLAEWTLFGNTSFVPPPGPDRQESLARVLSWCSPFFASAWRSADYASLWEQSLETLEAGTLTIISSWEVASYQAQGWNQVAMIIPSDDNSGQEGVYLTSARVTATAQQSLPLFTSGQLYGHGRTPLSSGRGGVCASNQDGWPLVSLIFGNVATIYNGRLSNTAGLKAIGDCSIIPDALRLMSWSIVIDKQRETLQKSGYWTLPVSYKARAAKMATQSTCHNASSVPNSFIVGTSGREAWVYVTSTTASCTYGSINTNFNEDSYVAGFEGVPDVLDFASVTVRPSYAKNPFIPYDPLTDVATNASVLVMPVTAGAIVPVYNVPGAEIVLVLSLNVIADIYLGNVTRWNDERIRALNPSLNMPDELIRIAHASGRWGDILHVTIALSKVSSEFARVVGVTDSFDQLLATREGALLTTSIDTFELNTYSFGFWTLESLAGVSRTYPALLVHPVSGIVVEGTAASITAALNVATTLYAMEDNNKANAKRANDAADSLLSDPTTPWGTTDQGILLKSVREIQPEGTIAQEAWPLTHINYHLLPHYTKSTSCVNIKALADWVYWMAAFDDPRQISIANKLVIAGTSSVIKDYVMRQVRQVDCNGVHVATALPCINDRGELCSNHGTCSNGGCKCNDGFTGPQCATLILPSPSPSNRPLVTSDSTSNLVAYVVGPVVGGTTLFVIIAAILIASFLYVYLKNNGIDILEGFRIDFDELVFKDFLGSGGYGSVFSGNWKGADVAIKAMAVTPSEYEIKDGELIIRPLQTPGSSSSADHAHDSGYMSVMSTRSVGKMLKNPDAGSVEEAILNEITFMRRVVGPSLVAYLGVSFHKGNYFLVMEHMKLGTLFDLLHNELVTEIPFAMRLKLAREAAVGIDFLHRSGIAHRDLKSMNLLLDKNWNVKVSDFGLSTLKGCTRKNKDDNVAGSVHWTAPEILLGEIDQDLLLADVYSFGIILWEIFSRQKPYPDMKPAAIAVAVIRDHMRPHLDLEHFWRPIEQLACDDILVLIQQCWHYNPDMRPTMQEVVSRLANINGKVEGHYNTGSDSSLASSSTASVSTVSTTLPIASAAKKKRITAPKSTLDGNESEYYSSGNLNNMTQDTNAKIEFAPQNVVNPRPPILVIDLINIDYKNVSIVELFDGVRATIKKHQGNESVDFSVGFSVDGCIIIYFATPKQLHACARQLLDEHGCCIRMGADFGECAHKMDHSNQQVRYEGALIECAMELAALARPGEMLLSNEIAKEGREYDYVKVGDYRVDERLHQQGADFYSSCGKNNGVICSYDQASDRGKERMSVPQHPHEEAPSFAYRVIKGHYGLGTLIKRHPCILDGEDVSAQGGPLWHTKMGRYLPGTVFKVDERGKVFKNSVLIMKTDLHFSKLDEKGKAKFLDEALKQFTMTHLTPGLLPMRGVTLFPFQIVYDAPPTLASGHILTLADYLKDFKEIRRLTEGHAKNAVHLIMDLVEALQALHTENHCHGNLSHESVLVVDNPPRLVLTDLAWETMTGMAHTTAAGAQADVPIFLAPEILAGKPTIPVAEIYSFAIIFLQMLLNRAHPFNKPHLKLSEFAQMIKEKERPPLPDSMIEAIKTEGSAIGVITQLIQECWDEDPMQRPSADGVRSRIQYLFSSPDNV